MRQRLELFVTVCQAVQHAHQKGIIHRDLKPSNVLVTLHDTIAVPKIIDFGIAKATTQPLTERTLFTHFAQMLGTPLYMSLEQAEMNGLDVDTRSDVYALGVLLYELLTGMTPFESEALKKVGLDEMRRMIREEEPPTPSQRLSTLAAQVCETVSERRGVDNRRLGQVLRGELDWIVMKALEKDRDRRDESSSALAADVQRSLNDEAVAACPPSAGYRLRKYVRRHRRALVMAGTVAAVLVTATAVSTWQAIDANAARKLADERLASEKDARRLADERLDNEKNARKDAAAEAAIARAVSSFLQNDLLRQANSAPEDDAGSKGNPNLTVKEALDRASATVAKRFGGQPVVEAAIQTAIGEGYTGVDNFRLAAKHWEAALKLLQAHRGLDHPETVRVTQLLAGAYATTGRCSDAIAMSDRLLEIAKTKLRPGDPELLDPMNRLAQIYQRAGEYQRATQLLEEVVAKDEALRGPTAATVSNYAFNLAVLYDYAGQHLEAAARLEKIMAHRAATSSPDWFGIEVLALACQRAGKLDRADHLFRLTLEHRRKRKDSMGQILVARALAFLSNNLLLQNRSAEAEPQAREALALYEGKQASDQEWLLSNLKSLLGYRRDDKGTVLRVATWATTCLRGGQRCRDGRVGPGHGIDHEPSAERRRPRACARREPPLRLSTGRQGHRPAGGDVGDHLPASLPRRHGQGRAAGDGGSVQRPGHRTGCVTAKHGGLGIRP
jgi:tetratricopeptide (TPR) repeat protein